MKGDGDGGMDGGGDGGVDGGGFSCVGTILFRIAANADASAPDGDGEVWVSDRPTILSQAVNA